MTLDLFSQFTSPWFLGIPLILIAMIVPWLLLPFSYTRWMINRLTTTQTWSIKSFTKEFITPLNTPGYKWAMFLVSLMNFLYALNLLGLLPYTFVPTTQLALNLGLSTPLWLTTVIIGFRNKPNASMSHLLPKSTPTPLSPILIIIETISILIRPLSLALRLTINVTAGHIIMHLITSTLMSLLLSTFPLVTITTFIILVLLFILEIVVSIIQAYIFVLLLSLYLEENI
uniref:ATP synthase subunit a n=1 Tax=Osteocephalus aff. leoniae DO-2022 TaxID=2951407 RepID=A0A9E8MI84_9NEOB|nr:ATP synthase F0 subunit 6 [Osteocephalus aff. leoniae DO-2022]